MLQRGKERKKRIRNTKDPKIDFNLKTPKVGFQSALRASNCLRRSSRSSIEVAISSAGATFLISSELGSSLTRPSGRISAWQKNLDIKQNVFFSFCPHFIFHLEIGNSRISQFSSRITKIHKRIWNWTGVGCRLEFRGMCSWYSINPHLRKSWPSTLQIVMLLPFFFFSYCYPINTHLGKATPSPYHLSLPMNSIFDWLKTNLKTNIFLEYAVWNNGFKLYSDS